MMTRSLRKQGSEKVKAASRRLPNGTVRSIRGFTLIELLVVIAIILLLIGLIIPAVNTIKEEAKRKHTKALVAAVGTQFEAYYTEYERWPGQAVSGIFSFSDPMSGNRWTNSSQVTWVMGKLLPDGQKNYRKIAFWQDDTYVTDSFGDVIRITITNNRVYVTSVNL